MPRNSNRPTRETLKEICTAHFELETVRNTQAQKKDASQSLIAIFDGQLSELQRNITVELQRWLSIRQ